MTSTDNLSEQTAEMRRWAEERTRTLEALTIESYHECTSPAETRRALHELRVHQVELDVQNEELRRAEVESRQ